MTDHIANETAPETGEVGRQAAPTWLLTNEKINDLQVSTVQTMIDRAKRAHYCNVYLRINGKDELYEADWLKHLQHVDLQAITAAKDAAYEERNRCVALLCALLPAVRTRTAIEGWSDDWHGCVFLTLPNGQQASWHFHDSHAHLFAHVPEGQATWDGHTTPEKYERIEACCERPTDMVLVPRAPTEAMVDAYWESVEAGDGVTASSCAERWAAMLAAAKEAKS